MLLYILVTYLPLLLSLFLSVLAFSIGCVTVVTCCVTVIAGYYCVKR